jgi:hypothetical protein
MCILNETMKSDMQDETMQSEKNETKCRERPKRSLRQKKEVVELGEGIQERADNENVTGLR